MRRKGFVLPLVLIALVVIVGILAWAPWITEDYAFKKATSWRLKEANCKLYTPQNGVPQDIVRINFKDYLDFGRKTSIYYYCPPDISIIVENYFVSFLGTAHKTSSQQNPFIQLPKEEMSPETANWKIYTNTKYRFAIKYPNDKRVDIKEQNVFDNVCDQMSPIVGIQIYPANYVKDDAIVDFAGDLWISISFINNTNELKPEEYMAKNCSELLSKAVKEKVKLGENEALKLKYNQVLGEQEAAIISHKKDLFYIHAYGYSKEGIDKYFDQALFTFKFLD